MKRLILAASIAALASPAFAAGVSRTDAMTQTHNERAAATETNQVAAAGNQAGVNTSAATTNNAATPSASTDNSATVTTPSTTARADTGARMEMSAPNPTADSSGNQTQRRLESGRTSDPNKVPAQ